MEADFSGWATKAGLLCSDGRTIMPDAFKHQDKVQVPLVWQHGHDDPENVLGHALLEARPEGVYCYAFFNDSPKAIHSKKLVDHKDINALSIWANDLIERSKKVIHGAIREVSLVLSGANPGALIESVTISHSNGEETLLPGEAIIHTGLTLEHADPEEPEAPKEDDSDDETLKDIIDTMSPKQRDVLEYLVGVAAEGAVQEEVTHTNIGEPNATDSADSGSDTVTDTEKDTTVTTEVKHNAFEDEKKDDVKQDHVLSHAATTQILQRAEKLGSLKEAVEEYASDHLAHGITDIDVLFPDAHAIDVVPEWIKRRTEWVSAFLGATRKSPFNRIKTLSADLTYDEARAKGYIKGTLKKEEFFGVMERVTIPTTVYKKQKLDRDDIVDITDFDVVSWMKSEMRIMLDEEIARAGLIGDGRDVSDTDKINEQNIRPIAKDHELYTTVAYTNLSDASSSVEEFIDQVIDTRRFYKGTGTPNLYTTEAYIAKFLNCKDTIGRRIYPSLSDVASVLRVSSVIPVEVMEDEPDIIGILVNPSDYVFGATRGGEVSMFDDFDIDYNQYKYLIETRLCGALTKVKSAIVYKKTAAGAVLTTPAAPTFVPSTGVVTIPTSTGTTYKNADTTATLTAGAQTALTSGASLNVVAVPSGAGYYFATSEGDTWRFTRP